MFACPRFLCHNQLSFSMAGKHFTFCLFKSSNSLYNHFHLHLQQIFFFYLEYFEWSIYLTWNNFISFVTKLTNTIMVSIINKQNIMTFRELHTYVALTNSLSFPLSLLVSIHLGFLWLKKWSKNFAYKVGIRIKLSQRF